jgi:hypothetical protein
MSLDVDARASAILAGCLAARAAGRLIAVGATAWSHSATRRMVTVPGDRVRFWMVAAVTAVVVVLLGAQLGVTR